VAQRLQNHCSGTRESSDLKSYDFSDTCPDDFVHPGWNSSNDAAVHTPARAVISSLSVLAKNRHNGTLNRASCDFDSAVAMNVYVDLAADTKVRQVDARFDRE